MTIQAAGILFIAPGDRALFMKRGPGGDAPGAWAFPGGKIEDGETAVQAAVREATEECGKLPKFAKPPIEHTRAVTPRIVAGQTPQPTNPPVPLAQALEAAMAPPNVGVAVPDENVDFTTFLVHVAEEFTPQVEGEHTGWAWANIGQPPEPLHPGCRIALAKATGTMNELDVARCIVSGELTSPQRFANVSLFAMRITGTGVAYRRALNEFVYRKPENYLTPDFLQRCNGLPVIWKHPAKAMLDSSEFSDRIVGAMLLPYIKGEEVWGVAKIYDDAAVKLLMTDKLSTSPAVVFLNPSKENNKVTLDDGQTLLIEGKPTLLDHLAICEQGVWDKGGEPSGVENIDIKGDSVMPEEKKEDKKEESKMDADSGTKLDKLLSHLDSFNTKMDAMQGCVDSMTKRMDSMEMADKARKDAEDEKKEEEKKDAKKDGEDEEKKDADEKKDAKKDGEDEKKEEDEKEAKADSDVSKRISAVEALLPGLAQRSEIAKPMSDADYAQMATVQADADVVFHALGKSAPRPLHGETVTAYRRRMAHDLKAHSGDWKDTDVYAIADDSTFGVIEKKIYADAMTEANNPSTAPDGQLREIVNTDMAGRRVTTFVGKPGAWMRPFKTPSRRVAMFNTQPRG